RVLAFQLQRGQKSARAGITARAQVARQRAVQFGGAHAEPQRSQRGGEFRLSDGRWIHADGPFIRAGGRPASCTKSSSASDPAIEVLDKLRAGVLLNDFNRPTIALPGTMPALAHAGAAFLADPDVGRVQSAC